MTVTGPVDAADLGVILPHEHVLMDWDWPSLWPDVSHRPDLVWKELTIENLGEVRRNYLAIRDNALLDNIDEMYREVERFREAGGGTIIEVSTYGLHGNPAGLREISLRTGVHIIAGTGFYLDLTLPREVKEMTIEQMYERMMRDITEGFPGTDVRAGLIGEVGISSPMTPIEERSLRAAVRVQKDTGLAMNVHMGYSADLRQHVIGLLRKEGANFQKIAFAHCDGNPLEVNRELAEAGGYVEYDNFGIEFYVDNGAFDADTAFYFATDAERVRSAKTVIDDGLSDRLLFSQDVCSKYWTAQYGGHGYAHVLEDILPMLEHMGVARETLARIVRDNPMRLLQSE